MCFNGTGIWGGETLWTSVNNLFPIFILQTTCFILLYIVFQVKSKGARLTPSIFCTVNNIWQFILTIFYIFFQINNFSSI